MYIADRDLRVWTVKQQRYFRGFERQHAQDLLQQQTQTESPPSSTPLSTQPTTGPPRPMAGASALAAGINKAPDILNGFANLTGSIGGIVNQARANDIYDKRVEYENEQFKAQLQQNNAQFSQSLTQNQHQFGERLNFQTTNMDRAWKTANAMGLASPFQSQAPARVNPTGSNDGFVNLGNYAQQMAFGM